MAKRCRQLCIVLFVTLWFIIAEGGFCQLVNAELLQEQSEENDYAEDMDEALSELDLSDLELKAYGQQLSYMTYDFNMDHDLDIKPIAKSEAHFNKWIVNYPFYANIHREGVVLYGAASAVENAVEVQVAIISKH